MDISNHAKFSDSELGVSVIQTRNLDIVPQQESQEHTTPELENASSYIPTEGENDIPSEEEDELVIVETQMVEAAVEFAAASQAAQRSQHSHRNTEFSKDSLLLVFDDTEMMDIPEDRDPEQDYLEHNAKLNRPNLSGYDIPIGPFESEEYQQDLRVDKKVSLFSLIPGVQTAEQVFSASKRLAQSGIGNVTESIMSLAPRTRKAAVATRQVGQFFADSVLNAGQDFTIRVQESWWTWPRGINGGVRNIS
ncbi:hypothetical protein NXS19_007358 [Fusarium pseudograminearum]|uniref:Uncharacterized protein n=1 Tax=Fusarium pseudograminearum (strain CS3096) TaxID=1028729 RepID=K3UPZ4_FUSPC|nr:hypothetical protein FPSE_05206 [Fusarium pseudograminearum CS3096]EKJ74456.1 hypothetical protein FPSE_05206 [Fusarium pseudograminearum CS3096]KAF0643420.1 hypothetical protein FPSE5266_05206 [Fusarium pseudograminearum]UZP39542.1 hypothetical protein NXS19_007358 [Fusarium pseudograminearum]